MNTVAILNWKHIIFFYVTVYQCKWVSGVDTYEAEIAADSIIWELFANKAAECLNLRNSLITISSRKEAGNIQAKLEAIQNRRGRRIFVVETLETVVLNGHCFLAQS